MHDDDSSQRRRLAGRPAEVLHEDGLRSDLIMAEEAVVRFELRIIERLGEALAGTVTQAVRELPDPQR